MTTKCTYKFMCAAALAVAMAHSAQATPLTQTSATAADGLIATGGVVFTGTSFSSASADLGNWFGQASAAPGEMHDIAAIDGCKPGGSTVSGPCAIASANSRFTDTLHVVGDAIGTKIQIEIDFDVNAFVTGAGNYSLQSLLFADGFEAVIDSFGSPDAVDNLFVGGHKSLIVDTLIGGTVGLDSQLNVNVSDFLNQRFDAIVIDASHTGTVTAKILTPGVDVQFIGDDGHVYGGTSSTPPVTSVPEPASLMLFGLGAILLGARRTLKAV